MGTTRMHDSPRSGVVDRNCRVHELANLYVAGSSVFPTVGASFPTPNLVALALRLGNHVANELSAMPDLSDAPGRGALQPGPRLPPDARPVSSSRPDRDF
jgi:choline dehydrogenase-like flavoprotein